MFRNFLKLIWDALKCQIGWTTEMVVTGVTEIDAAIPEFWADGIMHDGNRESFWGLSIPVRGHPKISRCFSHRSGRQPTIAQKLDPPLER